MVTRLRWAAEKEVTVAAFLIGIKMLVQAETGFRKPYISQFVKG